MDEICIEQGIMALAKRDADLAKAVTRQGLPEPRLQPHGFATFLSIIVSQQLSTHVAKVIMSRVSELLGEVSAKAVLATPDQALRDTGLSWRKIEYANGLAQAVESGTLDINGLSLLSDEEAIKQIVRLKGFGRWSAEIYLMFSLGRQDIFPADDLGILVALAKLKGLENKPTPKQARLMTEHWQPWRSVGALFLWRYYQTL
ncbi:DNA-3-methyladenine glycosylase 2 family protein [Motilimonas pumila]|uniref:DNA-3-methyladenine glycosylase II n=1 Tax=Motilimonas pumila TaxID=2303987 RepID=A0A418YAS1_9GAMM|nr:DNA-3-methyladenine glycosylase 2 family protein [Motilimonas pumila]